MPEYRFCVVMAATAAALLAGGALPRSADAARNQVPNRRTLYQVTLTGTVHDGAAPVEREGVLTVERTLPAVNLGRSNERNPREVILISGRPITAPEMGAIWLGSNLDLYRRYVGPSWVPADVRGLDVVNMRVSPRKGILDLRVIEGAIPTQTALNTFTASDGIAAPLYHIIEGRMTLRFLKNGRRVRGSLELIGDADLFGSGQTTYRATLRGARAR